MNYSTLCIRCGKNRIESETWVEIVNGSEVTFTEYVCPDAECQKIVAKQLKDKKDALEQKQRASIERRKHLSHNKRPSHK